MEVWGPHGGTVRNSISGSRGDTARVPPAHPGDSGETEAEPPRTRLWGCDVTRGVPIVTAPDRQGRGGGTVPVAAVCPAGKAAGRSGLAGHQTAGDPI